MHRKTNKRGKQKGNGVPSLLHLFIRPLIVCVYGSVSSQHIKVPYINSTVDFSFVLFSYGNEIAEICLA